MLMFMGMYGRGELDEREREERESGEGMERSAITCANEALSLLKPAPDAQITTKPFLHVSNSVLQVLDKIGPTMAVMRQDLHRNVQRVEKFYDTNPSIYCDLFEIVKKEAEEGVAKKPTSCTRAIVWLTRSLDFAASFLEKLMENSDHDLVQVVKESYDATLKPWHGWISSRAFEVALKLVPDRKTFLKTITEDGEDNDAVKEKLKNLVSSLTPFLEEIHAFLTTLRLNRLKSP
ncbi:glycolipid transfer protein 3 [Amborella trichopoda]|uniref:Glycolipid transfer protein domain-containing protein n=1 Tax=Amborella trichopoda TaxID=13333 RepID=U5D2S1_AMBTC|nr:glycolipid transfer protein 3 [Amborella trichopoda]ERN19921.1 hypothetical protein AMTR_s00071p00092570 [Amborella trichopoda]|eukprot:XP_006858454.3 glycolipid transfer protein 3 [Amborella trichopoda]